MWIVPVSLAVAIKLPIGSKAIYQVIENSLPLLSSCKGSPVLVLNNLITVPLELAVASLFPFGVSCMTLRTD